MAGGFGTQTDVMVSVAGRLETINGELQGQLRSLQGRLEPLVADWQGQGSTAFQGTMVRWQIDAKRINDALLGIAERVRSGAGRYAANEAEAASMLNVLGDAGGPSGGAGGAGTPGGGTISSALG
ncbi:WXG100 family type VII secretion target [Actinomycetospora rhizophila]|uniref:WXG100 family type VII secretion target n=1 Tax=Actinomycetospora rhizophila TaxID=1416876 RepID=A0ABV9ZKT5_9PSEU